MPTWTRPHYQPDAQRPHVFYAVPGADSTRFAPTRSAHRLDAEPPQGLELLYLQRDQQPQMWAELTSGPGWQAVQDNNPALADCIAQQTQWAVLRGDVADDTTLDYLRNAIGLVTALLDAGGVAVFDPFTLLWRSAQQWREQLFDPGEPQPMQHVITWLSPWEEGRGWLHTRGMGVFGRPDLSVRNVHPRQHRAMLAALQELIAFQAGGGIIPEGQRIHIHGLRHDLVCRHASDASDPVFNNSHVELKFLRDTSRPTTQTAPTGNTRPSAQEAQADASGKTGRASKTGKTGQSGKSSRTSSRKTSSTRTP